jgi:putative hemolysin
MDLISLDKLDRLGLKVPQNPLMQKALAGYLKVPQMNKLYRQSLMPNQGIDFVDKLLSSLNISVDVLEADLGNLPAHGPFIVVANHPFGFLDGLVMLRLLARKYPDFKVMANYFLGGFEPISPFFIPLSPFGNNAMMNVAGLKAAIAHLNNGLPLGLFPAGEVASMQKQFGRVQEMDWDPSVVRFIRSANVPIVPMCFMGQNSLPFHLLGKIHPYLRTLSIPGEFFNQAGKNVSVRIGKPIMPNELDCFDDPQTIGQFIKVSLLALGQLPQVKRMRGLHFKRFERPKPLIEPIPEAQIIDDLVGLKRDGALLFSKSNYDLYLAKAQQIPHILREIGRLRELTFRQVGEGTNKSIDVDVYDNHYHHLFAVDANNNKIVGAYRLGMGDDIIASNRRKGFYVQSLFHLNHRLNPLLAQTLELGRSFVAKDYQQKPLPLFLLWQGILHVLKLNQQYRYLMGPVSISNDFSQFSRDLIIAFVKKYHYHHELAKWVTPKHKVKIKSNIADIDVVLVQNSNDLQRLDKFISGIEPRALKVPVLLKQYIRQNARIIGFNVDPYFNNSLDGLMLLDVSQLPPETVAFLKSR